MLGFLGVKPEEQSQVLLMLGTGFFIGIFLATYQVTAESLFLNKLSDQLGNAFLTSGVLGIVATVIFSFFQNRIRFVVLTISSMVLIIFATAALYYFYHSGVEEIRDITLFVMYCLIGPMTAILLLCYWGLFGRIFNFKQSKRIIGWIDTGQLIAIILANFLIPATTRLFPDTSNYLIVCNLSMVGSLICLIIISIKFNLARLSTDPGVREESSFGKMFKERYIVLLSFFLIISMVTLMFNQFSFQTLLNTQYPDQRDLTNFLAFFNGAIYVLSLVMQLFVNDRIISTYGIRTSLFVLPAVLVILSLGSILTGSIFGYTLEGNPQTFIYFFLFVALARLFNSMLRESLENPVYKLLFIPLDSRYRFGIQTKVEGVVNESGRFIAGAIIFLFALIPFFTLLWVPVLVLGLLSAYFYVTRNLYNEYKSKIRSKLETSDHLQEKLELGFAQITKRLEHNLTKQESSLAVFSFKLLEKINPSNLSNWINALMKSSEEDTREYALRRMNELKGLSVSENYVIRLDKMKSTGEDKHVLTKTELDLILNSGGEIQKPRIQRLTRSVDPKDRYYAAELLLHSGVKENISFLVELLNDNEHGVRSVAIKTATKKYDNEVIGSLIEILNNSYHSNEAMNALIQIGEPALNLLDNSFYRSGQHAQIMIRTVQIIGAIGGLKAKDLLWNKIDYPDKVIVSQVLLALGTAGFKAGLSQVSRIKYAIESDIADITWNLGAMQEIGSSEGAVIVKRALEREIENDIEHIYMLLAMLYDTRSIQLVKENIESGTAEGVTYAIELLDVFLSEQLKQRVIPVLDDISVQEKISRLEIFYPRVQLDEKLVLKFLINREFTQSNRWTKACVLRQIGLQGIKEFTMDLIAQLFNQDHLIRETAAWALYRIDPEGYHEHVARLEDDVQRLLNFAILDKGDKTTLMMYDMVLFFQRIPLFQDTAGITLSYLVDLATSQLLKKDEFLTLDERLNNEFFIIYKGEVQFYSKSRYITDFSGGQFLGERLSATGYVNSNLVIAKEDTVLLKITKDRFYELLADHVKLADRMLEFI